ncbi:MAG: glycerol-3-phosphate 1-O-acyltransferase PlsY [Bacillota bacterium]
MTYLVLIIAYLLGSIPFGYIITMLFQKTDIRKYGSGNIGATNVLRVYGWRLALPAFILDLLKGLVAVVLARAVSDLPAVYLGAGFLAMVGHSFPVYLKFKGGKAMATSIGVLMALSGWVTLIVVAWFLLVVYFSRYVSLGSMTAMILTPIFFLLLGFELSYIIFGIGAAILVVARHHENISRLAKGTESKIGQKKVGVK